MADVGGKSGVYLPHAILTALGIPALVVIDSDRDGLIRGLAKVKSAASEDRERKQGEAERAHANEKKINRQLAEYLGATPEDFPAGVRGKSLYVWDDTLEEVLRATWPEWGSTREQLVNDGVCPSGKTPGTYAFAAQTCDVSPTGPVSEVLELARALARSNDAL